METIDKKEKMAKTAAFLMIITVLAKIVGFIREAIIGYYFGANQQTDILYTASGFITGVVFAMTASISAAYIPTYLNAKYNGERHFLWSCIISFSAIGLLITAIFELGAVPLSHFLAPSYSGNEFDMLVYFVRLFSVGIVFSILANIFLSTLNAESIFGYAAISGLIYSAVSVLLVVLFNKTFGVNAIVYSVVCAYALQCIILWIRSKQFIEIGSVSTKSRKYLKQLLIASIPVLISNTTAEINHMVDRILGNSIAVGAVSSLSYAHTLFSLVFQIVCNTFITISFTEITNYSISNDKDSIISSLQQCIAMIFMLVLPVSVITARYGVDAVSIAFMRGRFDFEAASSTGRVLSIYAFSFLLAGLYMALNKTFYALDDYTKPTVYGVVSVTVNIVLSIIGSKLYGLDGIVWATVIANLMLVFLLFLGLGKKGYSIFDKDYTKEIITYFVAVMIMLGVLLLFDNFINIHNLYIRFLCTSVIGFLTYFIILICAGNRRVSHLVSMIKRKINK